MPSWQVREDPRTFWLEAEFCTMFGARRAIRRAQFVPIPRNPNAMHTYIRYWPEGVYAIARIYPRLTRRSRIKVAIAYYNSRGRRHRRAPLPVYAAAAE